MAYFQTTVSHSSTGVKTISPGFTPLAAEFVVSQKNPTTENFSHLSLGCTDGTTQIYNSIFQDTTGGSSVQGTDHLVRHRVRSGGTIIDKLVWDLDSFTATDVKYNVVTADVGYPVTVKIWG